MIEPDLMPIGKERYNGKEPLEICANTIYETFYISTDKNLIGVKVTAKIGRFSCHGGHIKLVEVIESVEK